MFTFFLQSYRSGILEFCGSRVDVDFDVNGDEGKFCFRKFDNGQYGIDQTPITRHPNILRGVIIGKKSWGLWKDQWSSGIVEWTFTRDEILSEFDKHNIEIPESLITELDNLIQRKKEIRNSSYYK